MVSIVGHPEFGYTYTRPDGTFDLAVNGGGSFAIQLVRDAYLPAQRTVITAWNQFVQAPDVVLVQFDTQVTTIQAGAATSQLARANVVSDADGTRQATLLFSSGTQAVMHMPDGTTLPLSTLNVRATEYTVGSSGPKAMPGTLPASSGYTYAMELSIDEAVTSGAATVEFDRPVFFYVENFLGFPVGTPVPVGYYDRTAGSWAASDNGKVINVLGTSGGLALLDTNGDGLADDATTLAALGVTDDERLLLATAYGAGSQLWRVPVRHFSPYDCNWPYGCEADSACAPPLQDRPQRYDPTDKTHCQSGSVVKCESQVLGESIPIVGTPYELTYRSNRVEGRLAERSVDVNVTGPTISSAIIGIVVELDVAGRVIQQTLAPAPNLTASLLWDGKDAYGRLVPGAVTAKVRLGYSYRQVYLTPSQMGRSFGALSATGAAMSGGVRDARQPVTFWQEWDMTLRGTWDERERGIAGWSITPHHAFDPSSETLYKGDGDAIGGFQYNIIKLFSNGGTNPYYANGAIDVAPDGTIYVATGTYTSPHYGRVFKVSPTGSMTLLAGGCNSSASGLDGGTEGVSGQHT
jgi:hypothetical protein